MPATFDNRIVGLRELRVLQACQRRVDSLLGGGAALAGVYLHHRLSADADLFFRSQKALREMVSLLWDLGAAADILVWTRDAFDSRVHLRASLPATIAREGKLLYVA